MNALEAALGHRFADRTLLAEALRHGSAVERGSGPSNQRLEFLGDRVLGLAIAAALFRQDRGATEGDLARRLNALVRRETCADRALVLGIDQAIQLGPSEEREEGRRKTAILADACEAVLAAVYLDAGFDKAAEVVAAVWGPLMNEAGVATTADPKTALQERLQAGGEAPPAYRLMERTGPDHAPRFVIAVEGEAGILGIGEGGSKREAEQRAAHEALAKIHEYKGRRR